jgi:translation initiation factor 2 beta subunit (eIF-2beta)/eIF-5
MSININNSDDENYRYKMPKISLTFGGSGNGVFTLLNNIDDISESINTPSEILCKFIAYTLGSSYNEKKKTITGQHANIQEIIFDYINNFVICQTCGIPEISYSLNKISAKKYNLESKCSACGNISYPKSNNKITEKCIDIINKYLNKPNTQWTTKKGLMV